MNNKLVVSASLVLLLSVASTVQEEAIGQFPTTKACDVNIPKIDSTSPGEVGIRVNRPEIFLAEGDTITIPITVKNNNMTDSKHIKIEVVGYPHEVRSSPTYSEPYNYSTRNPNNGKPVAPGDSVYVCHKFKATWDGGWSFNVTAREDVTGKAGTPILGFATSDIKIHSLPTKLADNATKSAATANNLTQQLVTITILAAVAGPAVAGVAVIVSAIQSNRIIREMRVETNLLSRTAVLRILHNPEENHDLYDPANTVTLVGDPAKCGILVNEDRDERRVQRKFLKVAVQNNGTKVAKGCTADIELISRESACAVNSFEPKTLRWDTPIGDPYAIRTDIAPHGGRQVLNVFFADECPHVELPDPFCGEDKSDRHLRAYVATPRAFREPSERNQDGLCRGKFQFRLNVYSEESEPTTEVLRVTVTAVWNELSMQIVEEPTQRSR